MDRLFKKAFQKVIEFEGGYVNNPSDAGGKTKFGITEKTAKKCGYQGNIKDLTKQQAKNIYYNYYWNNHDYNQVDYESIAIELFEQAVNLGPTKANFNLQHSYNLLNKKQLAEDGIIGVRTLAAVNEYSDPKSLLKLLNLLQGKQYINICEHDQSKKIFLRGWLKRVSL